MDTTDLEAQDRADMARLAAGQESALDRLMERHAAGVFHFLHRMLGNEEDAQDLAQETFVRVHQACASYRPERKFSTWLFTIAANLARNQFRWRSRHPTVSFDAPVEATERSLADALPAPLQAPDRAVDAAELAQAVRRSVDELPPDLRDAIVLCEWEERTVAEAAAILESSPKAVGARLYRARRWLRERLRHWL